MLRIRSRLTILTAFIALLSGLGLILALTLFAPAPAAAQDPPAVDIGAVTNVSLARTDNDHELRLTWRLRQTACKAETFNLHFFEEDNTVSYWTVDSTLAGNPNLVPNQTSTNQETYSFTMTKLKGGVSWLVWVSATAASDDTNCSDDGDESSRLSNAATPRGTGTPEGRDPNVKGPNRPWVKLYPGNGEILVTFGVYDHPDTTDDDVIDWTYEYYDGTTLTRKDINLPASPTTTTFVLDNATNDTEYEISVGAVGAGIDGYTQTHWNNRWDRDRFDPSDENVRIDRSTPGASPPAFAGTDTVANQTFTQGTAITALQLPTISDTGVTYELHPLPAGLSVSESGELSGTPTAPQGVTTHIWSVIKNDLTDTIAFTIGIKPEQPTGLAARGLDGKVELTWTAIDGVSGWQYEQDSGSWTDISSFSDATSHTVTGLTNDTQYSFKLRAVVESSTQTKVDGVASDAVTVTPSALKFSTATIADQAYTSGTQITQLDLPVAVGGSGGAYTYWLTPSIPPAGITYSNTALTWTGTPTEAAARPPATYYWIATDGADYVWETFTVSVTTKPEKPVNVAAQPGGASATLSWLPGWGTTKYVSHTAITKWQYRQSDDGTFDECGDTDNDPNTPDLTAECFKDIASSDKDTRSHEVTGLTNGTEYTFQVRAVNPAGDGAESDAVKVTPRAAPAAPSDLAAEGGNHKLTLTWTHTATVDGWFVREVDSDASIAPADTSADWSPWEPVTPTKSGNDYSYDLTKLVNGAQYWVQVRGAAGTTEVVYGTAATVSGTPVYVVPTPTGLTAATGSEEGTVTLSWDQAPDGVQVTSYDYRVRVKDTTEWQEYGVGPTAWEGTAEGAKDQWVVDALTGGTEYEFQVRLDTPYGESDYTASVTAEAGTGDADTAGAQTDAYDVQRVRLSIKPKSVQEVRDADKTLISGDCNDLDVTVPEGSDDSAILAAADKLSSCHSITTSSRYIDANGSVRNFRSGKDTYWVITKQ